MYFFAYGTLQREIGIGFFESDEWAQYLTTISKAKLKGDLVHLRNDAYSSDYPGAVNVGTANNEIYGTLYSVNEVDAFLKAADRNERFDPSNVRDSYYIRQEAPVERLDTGEFVMATLYVLNRDSAYYNSGHIKEIGPIALGDWLSYIKR